MSTRADWLQLHDILEKEPIEPPPSISHERRIWDRESFAEEQIRRLVQQVFFPGWPKPSRQVVFSAVDAQTEIGDICMLVAHALADHVPGSIGVVEANPQAEIEANAGSKPLSPRERFGSLRSSAEQVSERMWRVPRETFLRENGLSATCLRGSVGELRLDFDYTVFHGPPVSLYSEACVLSHLSDGVVLVLEANSTRRASAQKAKEMLHTANARLLGTVLCERMFPIPAGIYRRL